MQDFESYSKNATSGQQKVNGESMSLLKEFAKKYEGKSQDELISAILEEAQKRKAQGTLKNSDIDGFASMIRPMLNKSQKELLDAVVTKLKN